MTYMYIHVRIYMYLYITCRILCLRVHTCVCMGGYVCMYCKHMCLPVIVQSGVHVMYTWTYVHTYMYVHVFTQSYASGCALMMSVLLCLVNSYMYIHVHILYS